MSTTIFVKKKGNGGFQIKVASSITSGYQKIRWAFTTNEKIKNKIKGKERKQQSNYVPYFESSSIIMIIIYKFKLLHFEG